MPEVTIVRESDGPTGMSELGMTVRWPGGRIDHISIELDTMRLRLEGGIGPGHYAKLFREYLTVHDDGK